MDARSTIEARTIAGSEPADSLTPPVVDVEALRALQTTFMEMRDQAEDMKRHRPEHTEFYDGKAAGFDQAADVIADRLQTPASPARK
jgi:hypothetical protein